MINRCMAHLVGELRASAVADPLHERFLLAVVWGDRCRLAEEAPPPQVRLVLDDVAPEGALLADPAVSSVGNATQEAQE